LAFTTTVGAGGTSLIGTSGVDTTTFAPGTLSTRVFIGAQGDGDFVTLQANQATNYTIFGGAGNDTFTVAGLNTSLLKGDDGNDIITLQTNAVSSSTVSGLAGTDTINVWSNVTGALINGNDGNDTINIASQTGAAASTFTNNAKAVGGQGNDTINIGTFGGVLATLTSGVVNGQDGDDTINVAGVTNMTFGTSTIFGGQGSDVINASTAAGPNAGTLVLSGDLGADNITGGAAADTIFGGDGNDRIRGLTGADSMTGGAGTDTYVQTGVGISTGAAITTANSVYTFTGNAVDLVTDFTAGANGDILAMGGAGSVLPTILTSSVATALQANVTALGVVYAVSGNYSNGVFTFAAGNTGSDTLLYTGTGPSTFGVDIVNADINHTVIKGVNTTTLVGANFA